MLNASHSSLPAPPSADDYQAASRARALRLVLGAAMLALVAAAAYVGVSVGNPILPLVVIIVASIPVLLWRFPALTLYIVFVAACVVEIGPSSYADELTGHIPFFWNVNTIVQLYSGSNFKALPVNLLELFLALALPIAAMRAVYTRTSSFRLGAMFWPIAVYMVFVMLGWIHGMTSGGDFKISLQEVRSQFYFLVAYLIAVNIVRDMRQVEKIQWVMVIGLAIKGGLYTFRRYVTLAGLPLPDQGVGSHEEAFFFNNFAVLLMVLSLFGVNKRMRTFMWIMLPLVVSGNLACNRRAATAAVVIVIPVVLAMAYAALPNRRRQTAIFSVLLVIFGVGYYQIFKDSPSLYAQPARAIKSQFSPDARDASSNEYRDAENADLIATVKLSPVLGYGYGKRMLHAVPIADISKEYDWWDVMTHNQILWVWMRVGTLGFVAFWCMVCGILFYACQIARSASAAPQVKAVAVFAALSIAMLMIFGLLDLQLSNFRDMIFVGAWTGILSALPSFRASAERGEQPAAAERIASANEDFR